MDGSSVSKGRVRRSTEEEEENLSMIVRKMLWRRSHQK